MAKEYIIHVSMTPHIWGDKDETYYWTIIGDGCIEGFGWSKTPEQAWKDAIVYYTKYYGNEAELVAVTSNESGYDWLDDIKYN